MSCRRALMSATRTMLPNATQGMMARSVEPLNSPTVQFLTIPLYVVQDSGRICPSIHNTCRHFSSTSAIKSNPRSSFAEDYDEWYSHGKMGPRTRSAWDGESFFFDTESSSSSLLLNELERDAQQLGDHMLTSDGDIDDLSFEFELPTTEVVGDDELDSYDIIEDDVHGE
jgi:hypothetical protein